MAYRSLYLGEESRVLASARGCFFELTNMGVAGTVFLLRKRGRSPRRRDFATSLLRRHGRTDREPHTGKALATQPNPTDTRKFRGETRSTGEEIAKQQL